MATILWNLTAFFAQGIVIVYPPVLIFWIVFHSNIQHWRNLGKRAYWYVCMVWPLISGPLLFFRSDLFAIRWPSPWWMQTIGMVSLLAALWVSHLASRVISWRTLLGVVELEPKRLPLALMQTGIYSKTRNPMYLMHWLLILSAAALSGYAAAWGLFALDAILLPLMIFAEEKELRRRYGDEFADYMRRVPRFFPRLP